MVLHAKSWQHLVPFVWCLYCQQLTDEMMIPTPWAVCEHQAGTFDVGWTPKFLQVVQVCLDPASVDGKTMHPLTLGYMTTLSGPILASRTGKSMRDYLTLGYVRLQLLYTYYILYNCTLIRYHEGCWFILTACTTDTNPWYSMVFLRWAPWSQSFHLFVYRIYLQKAWKLDCTRTEAQHDRNHPVSQQLWAGSPTMPVASSQRWSRSAMWPPCLGHCNKTTEKWWIIGSCPVARWNMLKCCSLAPHFNPVESLRTSMLRKEWRLGRAVDLERNLSHRSTVTCVEATQNRH